MTPKECAQMLAQKLSEHDQVLEPFEIKLIEKFLEKNPPINYDWLKYPYRFEVKGDGTYNTLIFFNYFRWADSPEGFKYWASYQAKWLTFLAPYNLKHDYYNHDDFVSCIKYRGGEYDCKMVCRYYSEFLNIIEPNDT